MRFLFVLLVEDSEEDSFLIETALKKAGYSTEIDRVQTDRELKNALSRRAWDIVLSDFNLPAFDGLSALKIVRELDQDIPFILVSGAIGEETAVAVMKAGATDYVNKGQLHRLGPAVERAISETTLRRDRKRAQDLLTKSKAQLDHSLAMAHLALWEYDVRQDLFTFNDLFYSIFHTSAEKVGGYRLSSKMYAALFVHPADRQKVKNESLRALATKDPAYKSQFDHRMLYSDGGMGVISIRFSVVMGEHKKAIRVYGVVQDITEYLRAQEALRENEEKYRSIFDHSLDAILLTSPTGAVLDANPSACEMFGYTKEQLLLQGRAGLVDLADPRLPAALSRREKSGNLTAEITMLRSGGRRFHVEITSSVFSDAEGNPKTSMIIRDITERKLAEESLRNRDILLEKLSSNIPGMIYQCVRKPEGIYAMPYVSSAIRELFGCSEASVATDWAPLVDAIFPDDRAAFLEGFEVSARTMSMRKTEYRVALPGKPVKWILGQSVPEILPDGSILWYGFAADITDRKRAENEILKNELRLESLLRITHYKPESAESFFDYALEEAIRLTESQIGYIYYYNEDTQVFQIGAWSRTVMAECVHHTTATTSKLSESGFWAEAVRQRKPIMDNDFASPHALKHGYPVSHAPIRKFMTVPIFSGGRIVAVAGVANKTADYDSSDVHQLTLLMESVWRITEEAAIAKALALSETRYRNIFTNAQEGIFQWTPDRKFLTANKAMANILGYESPQDLMTSVDDISAQLYVHSEEYQRLLSLLRQGESVKGHELLHRRKDGVVIWVSVSLHPVKNEAGELLHIDGFLEDVTDRRSHVEQLRKALGASVHAIAASVEARDPYTAGHQSRVAELAVAIAGEMGLAEKAKEGLRLASTIHDLGKLSVPSEILTKPKRLLKEEFELIKIHCQAGYDILSKIEFPWPIARMVLEHHERMDGSGYPRGIRGDEILLESRILAVADVVESMASFRPYRPSLGVDAALEEIRKNSGMLYDPDVVDACESVFKNKKFVLPNF